VVGWTILKPCTENFTDEEQATAIGVTHSLWSLSQITGCQGDANIRLPTKNKERKTNETGLRIYEKRRKQNNDYR